MARSEDVWNWRAGGVTTRTRRLLVSISWLLYAVTITQYSASNTTLSLMFFADTEFEVLTRWWTPDVPPLSYSIW